MDFFQILILSIIQGLTEFLPVSSSGHLILTHKLGETLGWSDPGQSFDVALHVGSAIAVVFYFRKELWSVIRDGLLAASCRRHQGDSHLALGIIMATIPAIVFGLIIELFLDDALRSVTVVAAALIFFGLILGWATLTGKGERDEQSMTMIDFMLIGLAQSVALIPGTSRSGITISMGLFRNLKPVAAARFSFLLSVPAIFMAGGFKTLKLILEPDPSMLVSDMFLGMLFSALTALACIHFFMKLIQKMNLIPFVIYRIILGVILLLFFQSAVMH